jgi:hypothetical protein
MGIKWRASVWRPKTELSGQRSKHCQKICGKLAGWAWDRHPHPVKIFKDDNINKMYWKRPGPKVGCRAISSSSSSSSSSNTWSSTITSVGPSCWVDGPFVISQYQYKRGLYDCRCFLLYVFQNRTRICIYRWQEVYESLLYAYHFETKECERVNNFLYSTNSVLDYKQLA